jgi:hypothetical protein
MNKLARFLSVILGLCVIILYWFDWNLCEKNSPDFDWTFWNNYVVLGGYVMFIIVFFKNLTPNPSYTVGAVGVSIVYGILIAAYKRAGAECGSLGEGMDKMFYYNTETYTPFLLNNIALVLYAFFSFWEPKRIEVKGQMKEHGKPDKINKSTQQNSLNRMNDWLVKQNSKMEAENIRRKKEKNNDSLTSKASIFQEDLNKQQLFEKEKATKSIYNEALIEFYKKNSTILLSPEEVIKIATKLFTTSDFSGYNQDFTKELYNSEKIIFAFPEGIIFTSEKFYVFNIAIGATRVQSFSIDDFFQLEARHRTFTAYGRMKVKDLEVKKEGTQKFNIDLYEELKLKLNDATESYNKEI